MGPMFDTARPGIGRDHHVDPLPHSGYPDGHEAPLWRWLLFLLLFVCAVAAFAQWNYGWGVGLAVLTVLAYPRVDRVPGQRRVPAVDTEAEAVTRELDTETLPVLSPEEEERYRAIVRRLGRR